MSDVILISTKHGGMGHNFIIGLILGLYLDDPTSLILDQQLGHAHYVYSEYYQQFLDTSYGAMDSYNPSLYDVGLKAGLDHIPLVLNIPYQDDFTSIHQLLLLRDDIYNCPINHLIFTSTKDERIIIEANHWYKTCRHQSRKELPRVWEIYDKLARTGEITSTNIDSFNRLTPDEELCMIRTICGNLEDPYNNFLFDEVRGHERVSLWEIKFNDIMNNKEKIVSTLETITNRSRNNTILGFYDSYVDLQARIRQKLFHKELSK